MKLRIAAAITDGVLQKATAAAADVALAVGPSDPMAAFYAAQREVIADALAQLLVEAERDRDAAIKLALEATNGWASYAKRDMEHREITRLHGEINELRTR